MPAGAEHVDAVGRTMLKENFFGKTVDRLRRKLAGIFEWHFDSLHRFNFESVIFKEFGEAAIHVILKVSNAHQFFHAQSAESIDLRHRRYQNRDAIPFSYTIRDLPVGAMPPYHRCIPAHHHDAVRAQLCQSRDFLLRNRERLLKLLLVAGADASMARYEAHTFRHELDKTLHRARSIGRLN